MVVAPCCTCCALKDNLRLMGTAGGFLTSENGGRLSGLMPFWSAGSLSPLPFFFRSASRSAWRFSFLVISFSAKSGGTVSPSRATIAKDREMGALNLMKDGFLIRGHG